MAVAGAIQTRHYQDQNDKRVYIAEIIGDDVQFLARTKDNPAVAKSATPQKPQNNAPQEIEDDDLPF